MKEKDKYTSYSTQFWEYNCLDISVEYLYKAYMLWIWIKYFDNLNLVIAQPLSKKKFDQAGNQKHIINFVWP